MGTQKIQYIIPCAVLVKDNKVLLGFKHNSAAKHCQNKWEILGGRAKFGQSYEEALKSKIKQYLGVDIEIKQILGEVHSFVTDSTDNTKQFHLFVIPALCELANNNQDFKLDTNKIKEVGWFTIQEMQQLHKEGKLVDENDISIAESALKLQN